MATVLGVVGGSGGVGASTFAGALAAAAGASVLVDLDAVGGGLDVALGIESVPGARWSGLRVAGGRLDPAALMSGLPYLGSCAVLAADGPALDVAAVEAVLDAAAAAPVDAVVLDLPRAVGPVREAAVERCDLVVVLARGDVGGLVGAHLQVGLVGDVPAGVVVRRGRGRAGRRRVLRRGAAARSAAAARRGGAGGRSAGCRAASGGWRPGWSPALAVPA